MPKSELRLRQQVLYTADDRIYTVVAIMESWVEDTPRRVWVGELGQNDALFSVTEDELQPVAIPA